MSKIKRNLSTPESRAFWDSVEKNSIEYLLMLPYKRYNQGPPRPPLKECLKLAIDNNFGLELTADEIQELKELLKDNALK